MVSLTLLITALLAHPSPPRPVDPFVAPWTVEGTRLRFDAGAAAFAGAPGASVRLDGLVLGDGRLVDLDLTRFEVVTESFRATRGHRDDAALAAAARGVVHLRGTIRGVPGSLAYLAFSGRGAAGIVDFGTADGGGRFTLRPVGRAVSGLADGTLSFDRTFGVDHPEVPFCGGPLSDGNDLGGLAGFGAIPPGREPRIDVAADCDFEFFSIFGEAEATVEYVTAMFGAISAIYRRDCSSGVGLSFVRVFDEPDGLFDQPDPLGAFAQHWRTFMGGVERDVAHLLTGRRDLPYGGVAYLNAACGDFGYAVNGYLIGAFADPVATHPGNWDIVVVAHELGHNVGTLHTHNYGLDGCASGTVQRGTIMSYCHIVSGASANIDLAFHRVTAEAIESFAVNAACLTVDCDGDGVDDAAAIKADPSLDANGDGILDACQDCDGDGVLDPDAIAAGARDLDGDGRPDACEPDCNGNGVPDDLDIRLGASLDAFGNGIPDECEEDCDGNGISDFTELNFDMGRDRSRSGRFDACEDCDGDGVPDLEALDGSLGIWVTSGSDEVRELHPRSGVFLRSVPLGPETIHDLETGPDGMPVVVTAARVRVVDRARGEAVTLATMPAGTAARAIDFLPDGSFLLATAGGGIRRHAANGAFLGHFVSPLSGAAPIDPVDLAVRPAGDVLVVDRDSGASIVRRYGPDGVGSTLVPRADGEPRDFRQMLVLPSGDFLVVDAALRGIRAFAADGSYLGRFDVQPGFLMDGANGIAASADGRAALATGAASSSTVNGYRLTTGYTERTYRVYPQDAPGARFIAVMPPSKADRNGNLVPDACEVRLGDLDGDGRVGPSDLAILLAAWGSSGPADLDGDGTVGAADLAALLAVWG